MFYYVVVNASGKTIRFCCIIVQRCDTKNHLPDAFFRPILPRRPCKKQKITPRPEKRLLPGKPRTQREKNLLPPLATHTIKENPGSRPDGRVGERHSPRMAGFEKRHFSFAEIPAAILPVPALLAGRRPPGARSPACISGNFILLKSVILSHGTKCSL